MIHMKFSVFACNKCLACLKIQAYSCCIQESISRVCDKTKSVSQDAKEHFIFALFLRCAYNERMMVRLYLCLCLFAFETTRRISMLFGAGVGAKSCISSVILLHIHAL
jgi:hypothetical protein